MAKLCYGGGVRWIDGRSWFLGQGYSPSGANEDCGCGQADISLTGFGAGSPKSRQNPGDARFFMPISELRALPDRQRREPGYRVFHGGASGCSARTITPGSRARLAMWRARSGRPVRTSRSSTAV
jgi:hypothetical protein